MIALIDRSILDARKQAPRGETGRRAGRQRSRNWHEVC